MRLVRIVLLVVGFLGIIGGVVWIGQGTGYFPYPESSFMIDQTPWAWRGLGMAVVGVVLVFAARRVA
jgi:hypothetical protein